MERQTVFANVAAACALLRDLAISTDRKNMSPNTSRTTDLRWHVGRLPDHCPFCWQVWVWLPRRIYPLLHEYITLFPKVKLLPWWFPFLRLPGLLHDTAEGANKNQQMQKWNIFNKTNPGTELCFSRKQVVLLHRNYRWLPRVVLTSGWKTHPTHSSTSEEEILDDELFCAFWLGGTSDAKLVV